MRLYARRALDYGDENADRLGAARRAYQALAGDYGGRR